MPKLTDRAGRRDNDSRQESPANSLPALQERSRETRDRLIAAAEEAFSQRGYEGARIADIAKAAGCSTGSVYFRFKDKSALFAGIVERFAEEAQALVQALPVPGAGMGAVELIQILVSGVADLFFAHRGLFRAVVERGVHFPPAFIAVVRVRADLDRVIGNAVRAHRSEPGRDLDLEVRVATQIIYGFLFNIVINPLSPTRSDGERAIAELAKAVIAYLKLN
ncbi:MAG: TetR/AcrR family transcriptional regulator [Rhizomicrobium sp.]